MSGVEDFVSDTFVDDEAILPRGLAAEEIEPDDAPLIDLPSEQRIILRADLLEAAARLQPNEARYLVSMYYDFQEKRKGAASQQLALEKAGEPHRILEWTTLQVKRIEHSLYRMLDHYTMHEETGMGAWARDHVGIGPAISAALLSRIDVTKAPTAGHVWRYAGLDPRITWYGRVKALALVQEYFPSAKDPITPETLIALSNVTDRRIERLMQMATDPKNGRVSRDQLAKGLARIPWDSFLKLICWRMAQSFTYQAGNKDCVYGRLKAEYKARITRKNDEGGYAERAVLILGSKNFGADTGARKAYESGKLPPAHIEAMAKRWVAKLFLAHWWEEAYRRHYGQEPPLPYPIAHLGHTHLVKPDGSRVAVKH